MTKARSSTSEIAAYFAAKPNGSLRVDAVHIEKEFPSIVTKEALVGRLDKISASERVVRWASANGWTAEKQEGSAPCYLITRHE